MTTMIIKSNDEKLIDHLRVLARDGLTISLFDCDWLIDRVEYNRSPNVCKGEFYLRVVIPVVPN